MTLREEREVPEVDSRDPAVETDVAVLVDTEDTLLKGEALGNGTSEVEEVGRVSISLLGSGGNGDFEAGTGDDMDVKLAVAIRAGLVLELFEITGESPPKLPLAFFLSCSLLDNLDGDAVSRLLVLLRETEAILLV